MSPHTRWMVSHFGWVMKQSGTLPVHIWIFSIKANQWVKQLLQGERHCAQTALLEGPGNELAPWKSSHIVQQTTYWSWWFLQPVLLWCPGRSRLQMSCLDQASGNVCAHQCHLATACGRGHRWFLPRQEQWGFLQFVLVKEQIKQSEKLRHQSSLTSVLITEAVDNFCCCVHKWCIRCSGVWLDLIVLLVLDWFIEKH